MGDGPLGYGQVAFFAGVLWRRADISQGGSDGGLRVKESFPNPIGCRVTHRARAVSESLGSISVGGRLVEKLKQTLSIEKESLDFVGAPNTEGSSTTGGVSPVGAEDTQSPDGLLFEMLFVVASEESMPIERAGLFAVRAWRAFQRCDPLVTLLFGSENPHGCW